MNILHSLEPFKHLSERFDKLIEGRLWLKVLIALAAGVAFGLLLGPDTGLFSPATVKVITAWVALPGQLFLALIQMVVVPLVVASIVKGLAANNDPSALKRIGFIGLIFILVSTAIATTIGIGLGHIIQPGSYIHADALADISAASLPAVQAASFPSLGELPEKALSIFPRNPLASMVSGEMLQVILFATVLGFALLAIPVKQAQPLFDLFGAIQEVSVRVVSWAMYLAPIAVFGLITRLVATVGIDVLTGMLVYVLTVLCGLVMMVLVYALIVKAFGPHSIRHFFSKTKELLLLAFSTSSSAAVMPLSLQVCENELGVRAGIARFLIPLGATINMAGTALYQGVATVFLAQVFHIDLSISNYVFIVTMAVAASIGSPATPGAGIIILSMVLEGVGIPATGIALLLGVDRILDMCRTAVNVLGDIVACNVAQQLVANDIIEPERHAVDNAG
jgi:Na+/H+-dicarboxylate symporter